MTLAQSVVNEGLTELSIVLSVVGVDEFVGNDFTENSGKGHFRVLLRDRLVKVQDVEETRALDALSVVVTRSLLNKQVKNITRN